MQVQELMSTDLEVAKPDTAYKEIILRMLARNVSGLPVVDDQGSLAGIVTKSDVIRKQAWGEQGHRGLRWLDHMLEGRATRWDASRA
jgi:CBS-domain-containing membrane protein